MESPEKNNSSSPKHDNTNRLKRILRNFNTYGRMSAHMIRHGIPLYDIARSQFPMVSKRPKRPVLFTIEFTNLCNLRCVYCSSSRGTREKGMMEAATFSRVADGIKQLGIPRVRVVGGGEPTLHPEFDRFVRELASSTRYLSVLSNGNWKKPHDTIRHLLEAPVDLIEISVEGMTKEVYERSSRRGNFSALLENLKLLKKERDDTGSKSHINLRIMTRPSDRGNRHALTAFWKPYCDTMLFQRLVRFRDLEGVEDLEDLFEPAQRDMEAYPNCSLPFKAMEVNWNGNVPLCCYSVAQYGPPGFLLGNIKEDNLPDLWNGDIMRTYRKAHRERNEDLMPICKGCAAI